MHDPTEKIESTCNSKKPRRVWIAALLGLFAGPLAQVYVGRLRRAFCLWLGEFLLAGFGTFLLMAFRIEHDVFLSLSIGLIACVLLYRLFIVVDACLIARRDRYAPRKRYQRWWIYVIIYLLLYAMNYAVAYTCKTVVAEAFVIPDRSMSHTIQPGDRILANKFRTDPRQIQRNDLIVFRVKLPDSTNSTCFVKRVIGLPGETIEIKDEQVFINGQPFDDKHAFFDDRELKYPELSDYGPEKIPPDCFFVLGDNRRISKDSRILGPIPFSDYHASPLMIYWSQKRVFPDPMDTSKFWLGPIQWDRIGTRLD